MKIGFIVLGLLMAGVAVAYAMSSSEPDLQIRYKITINVQTPDGIKSGSTIREFSIDKFKGFNPDKADFNAKMRGEAVVVDLGNKKLFALIDSNSYSEMLYAFPIVNEVAPLSEQGIEYYKNLKTGTKTLLENKLHWPKFVTFDDLNDPTSVQSVDPEGLSKTFGEGFALKNIEIEVTDKELGWGVVNRYLNWLEKYKNKKARLNGSTSVAIFTNDLADNLGTGAFSTGEEK